MAAGRFWFGGWLSGKSRRSNIQADDERFSFFPRCGTGMREVVNQSCRRSGVSADRRKLPREFQMAAFSGKPLRRRLLGRSRKRAG